MHNKLYKRFLNPNIWEVVLVPEAERVPEEVARVVAAPQGEQAQGEEEDEARDDTAAGAPVLAP